MSNAWAPSWGTSRLLAFSPATWLPGTLVLCTRAQGRAVGADPRPRPSRSASHALHSQTGKVGPAQTGTGVVTQELDKARRSETPGGGRDGVRQPPAKSVVFHVLGEGTWDPAVSGACGHTVLWSHGCRLPWLPRGHAGAGSGVGDGARVHIDLCPRPQQGLALRRKPQSLLQA